MGGGGVHGQGKGHRLMGIKVVTTLGWQHAKVKSKKSNPPLRTAAKGTNWAEIKEICCPSDSQ